MSKHVYFRCNATAACDIRRSPFHSFRAHPLSDSDHPPVAVYTFWPPSLTLNTNKDTNPNREVLLYKPLKKSPAFYGIQGFITMLTTARHLFVSWATSSIPRSSILFLQKLHLIISFHRHLRLPIDLFTQPSLTKTLYSILSHACHMTGQSQFLCFHQIIWFVDE
jgi:hypothetical protein